MPRTDDHPHGGSDGHEEVLADLLWEYVDRLNAGEAFDVKIIRAEHPDLADELLVELEALKGWRSDESAMPETSSLGNLGDYTLRRQIGRGGMGVVYEAWQNSVERSVALKVLPVGIAADNKAFVRFMREAKTAAQLNHANVVGVHGMGVEENTPYYAMEFVDGETLAQILTRLREAEPEEPTVFGHKDGAGYFERLARAFADVADGLQHAHSKGVVHRDVKPSNLILDDEGKLRILDFGLARLEGQESLTLSGDLMGTVLYMSPEQAMAKRVPLDLRTDVYSLGATMYATLTGATPFRGKDQRDTLSQIIVREPRPPRQLNHRVPKELETIVLKCLRKDPDHRYGTAEALGQDLQRFVRGDPIEARPQGRWERLLTRVKANRRANVRRAVLLLLLGLVAILLYQRQRDEFRRNLAVYEPTVRQALEKMHRGRFTVRPARPGERLFAFALFGCCDNGSSPVSDVEYAAVWRARSSSVTDAIYELAALTRTLPDERDAHYQLARAYALVGRREEAREEISRTLDIDRDFVPARVLERELASEEDAEREAALEDLSKEYASRRDWQRLWLDAYRSERAKDWSSVVAAYDQLLEVTATGSDPYIGFSMEARMARGVAHLEHGEYYEASLDFAVVEDRAPFALEPTLLHAKASYRLGKAGRAANVVRDRFERIEPKGRDEAALLIAALYQSLGANQEALTWVARVRDDAIRHRLTAHLRFILGEFDKSIRAATKAIEGNQRDPVAHVLLAQALLVNVLSSGSTDDSLKLLRITEKAVELDGTSSFAGDLHDAAVAIHKQFSERIQTMRTVTTHAVFSIAVGLGGVAHAFEGYFDDVRRPPGFTGSSRLSGTGSVTADGQELYSDDWNDHHDIWVARRQPDGTWSRSELVPELSTPDMDSGPKVSADGLTLLFARRPRALQRSDDSDLFLTTRSSRDDPWGNVRRLDEINDPVEFEWPGSLSADGLSLYFYSSRNADDYGVRHKGGIFDMFVATRASVDEPFGDVRSIEELNGPWAEYGASISSDGLTIFWSDPPIAGAPNRPGTSGPSDLWMATRPSPGDPFGQPVNLGLPINTFGAESEPFVSPDWPADGSKLYFYRTPDGNATFLHEATWHSLDVPRFVRGDCTADGKVDLADAVCTLTWLFANGAAPGCVAATNTNGDAVTNISDATSLLNYLFSGDAAPAAPFPECGPGALPADEELGCANPPNCQ